MQSTLNRGETRGTLDAIDHRKLLLSIRDKARAEKGQRKQNIPYIPIDEILARAPPSYREVMKALIKAIFANQRDKDQNFWLVAKKEKENLKLRAALFSKLREKPFAPAPNNITESWADFPFYFELVKDEKPQKAFFALVKDQSLDLLGEEENFNATLRIFGFS